MDRVANTLSIKRTDPSRDHLLARIGLIADRIEKEIGSPAQSAVQAGGLPGAYLTRGDVEQLLHPPPGGDLAGLDEAADALALVEEAADRDEAAGASIRLRELSRNFDLLPIDVELLLVAVAPELDGRHERLFGYLADDLTIRRTTIGVALRLVGREPSDPAGRARLRPGGPLVDGGLVELGDLDRPFLARTVRVPDRVVMHLLGDDTGDPQLERYVVAPSPNLAGDVDALVATLRRGATLTYLRERRRSAALSYAAAAFHELGLPALVLRAERLAPGEVDVVGRCALRRPGSGAPDSWSDRWTDWTGRSAASARRAGPSSSPGGSAGTRAGPPRCRSAWTRRP